MEKDIQEALFQIEMSNSQKTKPESNRKEPPIQYDQDNFDSNLFENQQNTGGDKGPGSL
jgi:hypothetical protein